MSSSELTFEESYRIKTGHVVAKDYFYVPVFYHMEPLGGDWEWYSLRFTDASPPASLTSYASKVPANTSLKAALIQDLRTDFHYPETETFVIDELVQYDTAKNRHGETLTRLLVVVGLDFQMPLETIHPLGMTLHWQYEDYEEYNLVKAYFPRLSRDLYFSQSYVHIPMDGSQLADPSLGPQDRYFLPDGSIIPAPRPIWF